MARKDNKYAGAPAKQVHRSAKSNTNCGPTPKPVHGRQGAQRSAEYPKSNLNSTFINLLQTIEQQAITNEAVHQDLRKEKASRALLCTLLHQNMAKGAEYQQALDAVGGALRTTNETLQSSTKQLRGSQDELQQAEECIKAQDSLIMVQAQTICNLEASAEALGQQSEVLENRNSYLNKQLVYDRNSNKTLLAELESFEGKLAAAEANNSKLAQHNEKLKEAAAGDYTAIFSTALAGGSADRLLLWMFTVLVSAIVRACVLLHILMFTTLFSMLLEGLVAAPRLLRDTRIYAVVLWGLACDLCGYLSAVACGCWSTCCVGCAGLLHSSITSTKSYVRSTHSSSMDLWASSSERLLRRLSSWGSTCVTSADVTPVSSSRASVSADAMNDAVSDGAAADVFVVITLKEDKLAKATDM